jgi:hypothetical protein
MKDNSIAVFQAIVETIKYTRFNEKNPNEVVTREVLLEIIKEAKENFSSATYNPE